MAYSAAFYNGVRLWQNAKTMRVTPFQGSDSRKAGLSRRRGRLNGRSPSFLYALTVMTSMPQVDSGQAGAVSALSGAGRQVTRQVYINKTMELLIDQTGQDRGMGYLSWVEDDSRFVSVSAGAAGGTNVPVSFTGAGFVPALNDYVLLRDPTTGDGFVSRVLSAGGGGTIGVDLQRFAADRDLTTGDPTMEDVDITTSWRIYKVSYYYPRVEFAGFDDPEVPSRAEDSHALHLAYLFNGERGIVYPSAWSPTLT